MQALNSEYVRPSRLLDLARNSDIVSLHDHHTPVTENMIDDEFFRSMKQGSFIVNTARGVIIDEKALLRALESGRIAGAALDVLSDEYNSEFRSKLKDSPMVRYEKNHENLIITPHYGVATIDAWEKTQKRVIELVIETLNKAGKKWLNGNVS